MKKLTKASLAAIVTAAVAAPASFADTSVINSSNLMGWTDLSVSNGTVTYVAGAPEGLGQGSLKLTTSAENSSKAVYAHEENMALKDVTAASYWTKQYEASSAGGSASYWLAVDLNGDGAWDTNLVYEPYWQNDAQADPAPVAPDQWQQWDVAKGMLWSTRDFGTGDTALQAGGGGAPFYTLAQINASYPQAKLLGIGVSVGSYNPSYVIGVDGVTLNNKTYNFGEVSTATNVPLSKDDCKKSSWKSLTMVDGSKFKNQGQCVSYVATGQAAMDMDMQRTTAKQTQ